MSSSSSSAVLDSLIRLSQTLRNSLSIVPYTPPDASPNLSIKSTILSLLPNPTITEPETGPETRTKIINFTLCCAALASSSNSSSPHLSWIPGFLSVHAVSVFKELANAYYDLVEGKESSMKFGELEMNLEGVESERRLVIELMPEILPLLKDKIKESAVDASDEGDEVSAGSARVPVAYAAVASYQFRWLVTQVDSPYLGKLSSLVIPCALTALDHWSPEVKGQGMICFIHLAKNVNAAEIGVYGDVILDACCQNIASDDEIWHYVVEMSVLLLTLSHKREPRNPWYEKLLNEMLCHLERQPRNKQRRIAWLMHIGPIFENLGLVLLAHFRRIFPLFFKWMHVDDDETVLLVLERISMVVRLTWIRKSPYSERLMDELVSLYKESALKIAREDIRSCVHQILTLILRSQSSQFEATWDKYKDDQNLTALNSSLFNGGSAMVA